MATIKFYANRFDGANEVQDLINHTSGSGIGFFAATGFGYPVPVSETQGSTFLTDQNGADPGQQINNCQYPWDDASTGDSKVKINGVATAVNLSTLNNNEATLNIRFEHTEAVRTSQPKIIIYNRNTTIAEHAENVTTYVFEVRKPAVSTTANLSHKANSSNEWTKFDPTEGGTPTPLTMTNSPGPSGLNASEVDFGNAAYLDYIIDAPVDGGLGLSKTDYNLADAGTFLRHDWYVALSSEPLSIGEKTNYALYFTVDYI
jgi:hypothetical protein